MQNQNRFADNTVVVGPTYSHINNRSLRTTLVTFMKQLERDGRICPRPWAWARFFRLFNPRYEPCWLSSWWETTNEEKQDLFQRQLVYLAYRTDRFDEALSFLCRLEGKNWLISKPATGQSASQLNRHVSGRRTGVYP